MKFVITLMLYSHTIKLVRFYDIVDGLKTGYTDDALFCLTATAKVDNMRFIATVMGEPSANDRNTEIRAMIEYGFNQYKISPVIPANTILGKVAIEKGRERFVDVALKESLNLLLKKNEKQKKVTYEIDFDTVRAPVKKGERVGILYLMEDGKLLKEVDVVATKNIKETNLGLYFLDNLKDIFSGNISFK